MSKTIVITGASSGFGLQLASELHRKGFTVIGTSRKPQSYESDVPFKLIKLDITDDNSIKQFTNELFKLVSRVDVLINNAGCLLTGMAEETPIEQGKQQFETNFWGTVKITNALLPHFRNQKYGHIITVSSIVGLIGPPNLSYYSASKHAVEGYFKALRFELMPFNVQVSLVEPSWFRTNIGENAVAINKSISDYDGYREKWIAFTNDGIKNAENPTRVTRLIHKIIDSKQPPLKNLVGKMSGTIVFLQNYAPKLFEKSMLSQLTKAKT
ncbi:SDR family oxidoreductase [Flavobacterium aurantiibacter]|uniref:Short-chain dehydrogenase/reductase n=1 Tax=Flavobacterium aurantiibacter TaxID=2023067 RepID=A0A255ZP26_9FLAO|nr:SDR family oxidoreductase [Flavobacterium aurantiibacter]OYQ42645.1 short-chain dehydrogenase/reductase [Flavobacterium aurantiibacter]